MRSYLYDHGLPFSLDLKPNLDDIKHRVLKLNKAGLIIVDGGVGEGKTTLAVHIADYFHGKSIIFKEQLGMGGEDFLKKMKDCFRSDYHVVIYDEAGDFDRRGAIGRFNAMINRVFDTYRAFKIIVIIILPKFYVLDQSLMDKEIPRLLLHCQNRNLKWGNFKGYSLYQMHWLLYWSKKLAIKAKCFERCQPNFMGHFLDLPPSRSKKLDHFTIHGKLEILDEVQIKHKGYLSIKELARGLGRSYVWTRQTLKKLKIKESKVYKNRNFYEPYVLERLLEVIGK